MKLIRFSYNNNEHYGNLENDEISFINGDIFGKYEVTKKQISLEAVKILPPVKPSKVVAVGLNYKDHAREFGEEIPSEPKIFLKPPSAVIGYGDNIVIPPQSSRVDFEAEFAAVIGRQARNLRAEEALDYILGYTCLNDVTARDLQARDGQWIRAKGFDTFCPIGPYIDTEIDPYHTDIKLYHNGELKQHSDTKNFIFDIEYLISFISNIMTLEKGDVITTGTPSGVGKLSSGDKVSVVLNDEIWLTNNVTLRR